MVRWVCRLDDCLELLQLDVLAVTIFVFGDKQPPGVAQIGVGQACRGDPTAEPGWNLGESLEHRPSDEGAAVEPWVLDAVGCRGVR